MLASLGLGYILIGFSALFFTMGSYAILFSAFLPTPSNPVCTMSHPTQHIFIPVFLASQRSGNRFALQVLCRPYRTYNCILCYSKLGWLAILPKFLKFLYMACNTKRKRINTKRRASLFITAKTAFFCSEYLVIQAIVCFVSHPYHLHYMLLQLRSGHRAHI